MAERETIVHGTLPRLSAEHYRGRGFVHWTMTVDKRERGWLDPLHHARAREALCHALGRYRLVCPAYCLMPDHGHFLLCGIADNSDHLTGVRLFRQSWNLLLQPSRKLQARAYDHVLREPEREQGSFTSIAHYILENPARAKLVAQWDAWPFSGCVVPGYPRLDPRDEDYWEKFWRIWNRLIESTDSGH